MNKKQNFNTVETHQLNTPDVMNCVFRFSELFDGHIYVDDLVEKVYGVPYIEIRAKSESEAINKFKKKHSLFISYKMDKITIT